MFHLASSLYSQYTKQERYNILILGLDNAGKTSFLEYLKLMYASPSEPKKSKNKNTADQMEELKFKRILPTVGQNVATIKYSNSDDPKYDNINLKFWDLGGQKSLRGMWSRYYKSCHGIIFIIDSSDTERFQECYETLMDIVHHNSWNDGTLVDGDTVDIPILMMANKQDLPSAVDLVTLKTSYFINLVSELDAADSKLLPVSILENRGIKESLDWLVTRLNYNKPNRPPEYY